MEVINNPVFVRDVFVRDSIVVRGTRGLKIQSSVVPVEVIRVPGRGCDVVRGPRTLP